MSDPTSPNSFTESSFLTHTISSPEKHYLRFESIPIAASVTSGAANKYSYRGFNLAEILYKRPESECRTESDKLKRYYKIIILKEISSLTEIDENFLRFSDLKTEIESIWHYVFGFAYNFEQKKGTTLQSFSGWTDNHIELESKIKKDKKPSSLIVEFSSHPVMRFTQWPLNSILRALDNFRNSSEAHRFMMQLHASAIRTGDINIRLTLLGKLTDLCETLLPGDSRKNKIKNLPPLFKDRLVFDEKLFELANTRSLTRHAAHKNGTLHRGMSVGEIEDFQSDVDTLARYIAMEQLKIAPSFYEGWRFPPNYSSNGRGHQYGKEHSKRRDEAKTHPPDEILVENQPKKIRLL